MDRNTESPQVGIKLMPDIVIRGAPVLGESAGQCCGGGRRGEKLLHQNNIVLLLAVNRLYLQRNRLGDEIGKLRQRLRFLFQEQVDDLL